MYEGAGFDEFYDVIILGAGLSGLSTALKLSTKGLKPLIVEEGAFPGGIATTFIRGRFEFEALSQGFRGMGSLDNPMKFREFLNEACSDVEWIQLPEAYRLIVRDKNIDVTMPFGIENMINAIENEVPNSKSKVLKLINMCEEVRDSINYIEEYGGIEKIGKFSLMLKHSTFYKTSGYSAEEVLNSLEIPEKVIEIMCPFSIYYGMSLSKILFTSWALLVSEYFQYGAATAKYKIHILSATMEKSIREHGGVFKYNTSVTNTLVENNKVIGVMTDGGERIRSNYVISSINSNKVYSDSVCPQSEVSQDGIKMLNVRKTDTTPFVVYLGLNASIEELNITNYRYIILDTSDTERIMENTSSLQNPAFTTVVVDNVACKESSPLGTTQMTLSTFFTYEAWADVKPENYYKVKQNIAERLIEKVSNSLGVNIFNYIEEVEVATSITFEKNFGVQIGEYSAVDYDECASIASGINIGEKFLQRYEKGEKKIES